MYIQGLTKWDIFSLPTISNLDSKKLALRTELPRKNRIESEKTRNFENFKNRRKKSVREKMIQSNVLKLIDGNSVFNPNLTWEFLISGLI